MVCVSNVATHEDRAAWRRGVLASYEDMTPKDADLVDANNVSLPLQLALTLAGILVALVVGYYTGQGQWSKEMAGLRSDVRDGFTMLQGDRKADAIRMDVIRRDLDEAMRTIKLHDIKIQEDHDELVLMKRGTNGRP